jgi:serine/threonine-protein kinase RsbT
VRVALGTDRIWVGEQAARLARSVGLDAAAARELAIAVSELVTNAVKFAGGGRVTMTPLTGPTPGVEVTVDDDGPGFADPSGAVVDGYSEGRVRSPDEPWSKRRGMGVGLGGVMRLTDELVISNRPEGGARVVVRKRQGASRRSGTGLDR